MTLYIDADACPVKDEVIRVAERRDIPVVLVSNRGFRTGGHPLLRSVVVEATPDAADNWIAADPMYPDSTARHPGRAPRAAIPFSSSPMIAASKT